MLGRLFLTKTAVDWTNPAEVAKFSKLALRSYDDAVNSRDYRGLNEALTRIRILEAKTGSKIVPADQYNGLLRLMREQHVAATRARDTATLANLAEQAKFFEAHTGKNWVPPDINAQGKGPSGGTKPDPGPKPKPPPPPGFGPKPQQAGPTPGPKPGPTPGPKPGPAPGPTPGPKPGPTPGPKPGPVPPKAAPPVGGGPGTPPPPKPPGPGPAAGAGGPAAPAPAGAGGGAPPAPPKPPARGHPRGPRMAPVPRGRGLLRNLLIGGAGLGVGTVGGYGLSRLGGKPTAENPNVEPATTAGTAEAATTADWKTPALIGAGVAGSAALLAYMLGNKSEPTSNDEDLVLA